MAKAAPGASLAGVAAPSLERTMQDNRVRSEPVSFVGPCNPGQYRSELFPVLFHPRALCPGAPTPCVRVDAKITHGEADERFAHLHIHPAAGQSAIQLFLQNRAYERWGAVSGSGRDVVFQSKEAV